MSEQTPQQQFDTAIMREYIGFMHKVIVIMLVAIFGMGAGFVYDGYKDRETLIQMSELMWQRDEAILENLQMKELTKPVQKKIDKAGGYISKKYGVPIETAKSYARQELINAQRTGIPFAVGLAITDKESSFNPDAISYTGCCYGLKQVHLRIWSKEKPGLTKRDLYDPYKNIAIGYDILKEYYQLTGSLSGALGRYYGSTVPEQNLAYAEDVIRRSQQIARALS